MTTATIEHAPATAESLADRLFGATVETMLLATIHIGRELGLYDALKAHGPLTAPALASHTGTDQRYVREWLEQQAVTDILAVHHAQAGPGQRVYELSDGHAEALLDPESPYMAAPFARYMIGLIKPIDATIDAFRTGAGVPYDSYPEARIAQAETNRPIFKNDLAGWIAELPDLDRAFTERGGRVADVACGAGWSTIELARTYPRVRVDGYDLDAESIRLARENVAGTGVEEQVRFFERAGAEADAEPDYDLVTIFEAIHDMARPVEVLESARRLTAAGGVVLVADEKAHPHFAAPGDPLEQLLYGFSVLFCLPTGRDGEESVATGTVMRPSTLEGYADAAGFRETVVLPIEHDSWRFYLLVP